MPAEPGYFLSVLEQISNRDNDTSVKAWLDKQASFVKEGVIETMDKAPSTVLRMYERRLKTPEKCDREWTPSVFLVGEGGNEIETHYPSLFATEAYKNKLVMAFMSPDEFLGLTAGGDDMYRCYRREKESPAGPLFGDEKAEACVHHPTMFVQTVDIIKDKLEKCKPMDTLWLDVNEATCQVYAHEGRHRAIAAKALGISTVPVWLIGKDADAIRRCTRLKQEKEKFR